MLVPKGKAKQNKEMLPSNLLALLTVRNTPQGGPLKNDQKR